MNIEQYIASLAKHYDFSRHRHISVVVKRPVFELMGISHISVTQVAFAAEAIKRMFPHHRVNGYGKRYPETENEDACVHLMHLDQEALSISTDIQIVFGVVDNQIVLTPNSLSLNP